jgi:SulP family sulfate permease
MLVADPALLAYMPKFILGGLLIYLGSDQLNRWIIESRRRLSITEYHVSAMNHVIIAMGFFSLRRTSDRHCRIGCATFALSASRISAIRFGFNGASIAARSSRSRHDLALLMAHGKEIHGLNLQGYPVFWFRQPLISMSARCCIHHPECRYLVF